jgi:hypothetical protein
MATARTGIRYVGFWRKRGTVARSAPDLGDAHHAYPMKVCRLKQAWQADFRHDSCLADAWLEQAEAEAEIEADWENEDED